MKTKLALSGAALAICAVATPAQADVLNYGVTNATGGSCPHGLWTNSLDSGCSRYYSFQEDARFSVDTDAGTGTFTGTAINPNGEVATLDLSLSGLLDSLNGTGFGYKAGGGAYDPSVQDYFTNASGTITVDGVTYTLNPSDPFAGNTVFQFGTGANDKTGDFGGSSWLNMLDPHLNSLPHFDINFDLALIPGTPVPAPAGLLLFGLGLAGAWGMRRRKQLAAA
ncbi:PEP-CTERM sorting domain-containing protein [Aurantiacibacter sp. MUD61]|uniref:PEP-CTERM sorting domain-containing protein n=1 Tax=Aurantiacibacter sp. MUD61 TaxID=3009083 RepID=UPI0022F11F8F|nr:PEP-CTERM sorting domain-containing protein [Aurantiacibacter sp. MUD61]